MLKLVVIDLTAADRPKYESGRKGDSINVGFSPRKSSLVLYVLGSVGADHPLLAKLGKHKTGKACLYVNKLDDIDISVLEDIINISYKKQLQNTVELVCMNTHSFQVCFPKRLRCNPCF